MIPCSSRKSQWIRVSRESHYSVVRLGECFKSHSNGGTLHSLRHHLDFFLFFFFFLLTETGDALLPACWEGSGTSSFPTACGCMTYCVKRYSQPTWKSEVKNCDLPTGTALKTFSYSCNAADARAAAQLWLALNTADAKPEMLQGTSVMFTQSC